MPGRSFIKDLVRSIWKTAPRFLSILAIIALGVGFFVGIHATEPDMLRSADAYYQASRLADFRLVSPLGFQTQDIKAVQALDGVALVQEGYSSDFFMTTGEGLTATVRAFSYDPADYLPAADNDQPEGINRPQVMSGRMPEQPGEIAVDHQHNMPADLQIGRTVTLSLANGETANSVLRTSVYTIVGTLHSPQYLDLERGQTPIGDGSIDYFVYLPKSDFTLDLITDLFVRTRDTASLAAYSLAYEQHIEPVHDQIESLGESAVNRDTRKLRDELVKAKAELLANKTAAEQELADAEQELRDAEQAIIDGEQELQEQESTQTAALARRRADLEEGKTKLDSGRLTYMSQYITWMEGYNEWQDNRSTLIESKASLDDAASQIANGEQDLAIALTRLEQAKAQIDLLRTTLDTLREIRAALPEEVPDMDEAEYLSMIAELRLVYPALADYIEQNIAYDDPELQVRLTTAIEMSIAQLESTLTSSQAQYDQGMAEYQAGERELADSKRQYAEGLAAWQAGETQLRAAKTVLDDAKIALDQARSDLTTTEAKLASGEIALTSGEERLAKSIAEGKAELEQARRDLASGKATFDREKTEAMALIADAQTKIRDAERQLVEIPDNWFILTRNSFPGYSSFEDDARRMGAVARIFPLFFFLVAALVCLTTMTRMVEEERLEIGTLKAIGYGSLAISSKYLIYALLASLSGAAIGLLTGFSVLPKVIMNAYGIMYSLPDRLTPYHHPLALIATAIAVMTTLAATLGATLQELKATPAVLMQPRAPKPGKRILLERFAFLWRRLSFSHKVTARNLFRYKKRMLMTVLGISGCTALLLTGFGLRDSINAIVGKQFDEIFLYDGVIALDRDDAGSAGRLEDWLDTQSDITAYLPVMNESVTVLDTDSGRTHQASLLVPEEMDTFAAFYDLHERMGGTKLDLPDQGAVITEKLASLLRVRTGDTLTWRDSENHTYSVTIAGIAENYLAHYLYLSPAAFDAVTFRTPLGNSYVLTVDSTSRTYNESALRESAMGVKGVLGTFFIAGAASSFADTIGSLDYVVIVLIACAGALAFVVLYNLTNINMTERMREIATIKVLGFRDREVLAYVYRENVILTLLGAAAGLALGFVLHQFVIDTMEIDTMMFGRNVHILSYVYAVVLTFAFSLLVNVFMNRKLRTVNMVASLKSVE